MARFAFLLNGISVFIVFATIFYIIHNHYFEYNFAWEHSSKNLDPKYMLSCIWEAQEGSFLLWMMWNAVLGTILMFRVQKWEAPMLTIISFAQFCLTTMILGVYVFSFQVGHSPFMLVRQLFQEAPIFQRADYLSIPQMQDGQSLNALLAELLDGYPSADSVSRIFIHTHTICICRFRTLEERVWLLDKNGIALDPVQLLCAGYRYHDGSRLGL